MKLSYDIRLGVIFSVEKSIAWNNLEEQSTKAWIKSSCTHS